MSATAVVAPSMWTDLVDALSELTELPRSRTANTGSYSYSYADLGDALSAVRPKLKQHGFAITQPVCIADGLVYVTTTLLHRSGDHFESPWLGFAAPSTPQAIGSVITYGRRYSLMATLGLGTDDDDGAAASSAPVRATSAPARTAPPRAVSAPPRDDGPDEPPKPTEAQSRKLHALLTKLHLSERTEKLQWIGGVLGREISSTSEVTRLEAARLIDIAEELHASDPWAVPDADDELPEPTGEGY
jgi:ERF superfamily